MYGWTYLIMRKKVWQNEILEIIRGISEKLLINMNWSYQVCCVLVSEYK